MRFRGRGKGGRDRGFVEVGVAAAGALLVLGAVVGNGVAATILDMSDGQTWLPDDDGRVVQVNPATGEPERRLVVGSEGSEVEVAQRDGHLIVTDPVTGEITSIDLTGLVASGSRGSDTETWVLIGGGQVVLVEPSPGTVRAVDPLTLTDLGTPYRTDDLAHAVIDDDGSVWVLTTDGELAELDFAAEAGAFVVSTQRPVAGAGSASQLVPHSSGVTVFAPDGGAIVQVGTGAEVAVNVPALDGQVAAADRSDADLVPASASDVGRVFMLTDGQVLNVDVGSLGCTNPGAPAVLAERVYIPCLGAGRVIVLDADGARAGDDVVVPGGGDPMLLVDEGRLFVHSSNDDRIVLVQPDGSTQVVDIGGAEVPEHAVDQPAPPRPPANNPPQPPPAAPPANANQPESSQQNTPPADRTQGPPEPQDEATQDSDVADDRETDQVRNDVDTDDSRQDDDGDNARQDEDDDSGGGPGDGRGDEDDADTGDGTDDESDDGTADDDGTEDDDSSEEGDGDTEFTGPTNVQATVDSDDLVQVTWTAPEADVREYTVTSSDGSPAATAPHDATSATLDVASCETSVTITVTAQFDDGDQASGNTAVELGECDPGEEPGPDPAAPTNVQATMGGIDEVRVTWTAPDAAVEEYIVTSSDGSPARTVAGHRDSTNLEVANCDTTVTITVTAYFPGGEQESANTTVHVPDCSTAPDPAPPTNVQASLQGDDEVRVTWTAPEAEVQEYTVTSSDGSPAQTVAGDRTTATLEAAGCDGTVTITVTAYFPGGGGVQESASDSVSLPDCAPEPAPEPDPAPPTNVQASLQGDDEVQVTWTAPEAEVQEYVVTSSDGSPAQTVSGASTTATLGMATCGTSVTLTVTAHFSGGVQESATATVTAPTCAPDPVQATAPTNVVATAGTGGQVTVSWTAASSGADTYRVYPSGVGATDAGTSTSLSLTLPPGQYTFEVEAELEGTTARSASSNSVTVAGVPGAPGTPTVSNLNNNGGTVTADVSWPAASGNGASVTLYTITYSGGGVSSTTTTNGSTSTSLNISCGGQSLCTSGGTLNVTVTATNAEGTGGSSGTGSGSVPPPPPPPPTNGANLISVGHSEPGLADELIPMHVYYSPDSTWAAHTGICTLYTSSPSGNSSREIPCGQAGTVATFGVYQFQEVSAYVVATGGQGNATSATGAGTAPARNTWAHCPPVGQCTDPVSLPIDPDGDPDVEYIPAPWTPPEVPNPPVLVAGLGLLGLAGIVRALRNRAGLAHQVLAGDGADPALSTAVGDPPR